MLDFILGIIQTPAIVLGLVALIGLIIQKKKFSQIFSGTVKTAIGMLMVGAGAGLVVNEILPFVTLFQEVTGLEGFATGSEAIVGALQGAIPTVAASSAIIMGAGFLVNILIARFTPIKYIFLTGHMMWILSVVIAFGFYAAGATEAVTLILGSLTQGLVMSLLPAIGQPLVRKVTGSDNFAIAHLTTLGTVPSAYIGGLVGNKEKSAEDIKLPESLSFFKDTSMSISIVIGVFYLIVCLIAGPSKVAPLAGGANYIIFAILKALGFTMGILVLLQGVRMFLGELVPAFKGISDKLVPGAIPALDVPVLFAYAPNSLMIGFITAVVGMVIGMFASSAIFKIVPLVSIIGAFFTGGVAGIYGNKTGGRVGAAVSGLVYGFLLILGSALLATVFDFSSYGAIGVGHDCIDAMVLQLGMINPYIGFAGVLVLFVVACILRKRYLAKTTTK